MAVTVWPVDAVAGQPEYSGRELRQAGSARYAGATAARPLGTRSGVRPGTAASTAALTGMTWTIKPHAGVLDLQASASAGVYEYANDADVTGAVTAASGSIIRKDILYIQLSDPAEGDGTSTPKAEVLYQAGTVANTAPALPARSMRLATITVPVSGTGSPTIVLDAPFLAAAGGIANVRDTTERAAWASGSTPQAPAITFRGDAPAGAELEYTTDGGTTYRTVSANGGLTLITPTSVAGTGVTLSGGAIVLSGSASASVNGVFTSRFDNYKIVIDIGGSSAATDLNLLMRAGGTNATDALYAHTVQTIASGATTPTWNAYVGANGGFIIGRSNGTGGGGSVIELQGPALANYTKEQAMAADAIIARTSMGSLQTVATYDGFTLNTGSGGATLNGRIRVYGYNNG